MSRRLRALKTRNIGITKAIGGAMRVESMKNARLRFPRKG